MIVTFIFAMLAYIGATVVFAFILAVLYLLFYYIITGELD